MAMYTTTPDVGGILPDGRAGIILAEPVSEISVAAQVSTVLGTGSTTLSIPIVRSDPSAAWLAEGAEIAPSDMGLDELLATPAKVAGLTVISRELANDSNPSALALVQRGLARDIARKVDQAYFAGLPSPAPAGLSTLAGVSTAGDGAAAVTNLDLFAEAISNADAQGAAVTTFVVNPADALTLAQLKDETGSNRPLLGTDPSQPTRRTILGVPMVPSQYVPVGTAWAIPKDYSLFVRREDTRIEVSQDVYFTSDRIAVRGVMRCTFAFPWPEVITRIDLGTAAGA
jgi:HK97 family phage major capsid protein